MNDRIRAKTVRVVAPDGAQIGLKEIDEALWLANQLGMDLVEVAPGSDPPVCRLMDYGKYKYEQSVKAREGRKKSSRTVIKEVKFKTKIDSHDFDTKVRRAAGFLEEGHKIKAVVMFFGREITHPERGRALLDRMVADLEGIATVESPPRLDGRNMTMVLLPDKPGIKARAEAAAEAAKAAAVAEGQAEAEAEAEAAAPPQVETTPEPIAQLEPESAAATTEVLAAEVEAEVVAEPPTPDTETATEAAPVETEEQDAETEDPQGS